MTRRTLSTPGMTNGFGDKLAREFAANNMGNTNREMALENINPMHTLNGFIGHLDTPVEILHVFALGVVKSISTLLLNRLGKSRHKEMKTYLRGVSQRGLGDRFSPSQLVDYNSSLVGRDFKIVTQIFPFAIYYLIPDQVQWISLWCCLSHLATLLYRSHVPDMESYIENVKVTTQNIISHVSNCH